ncbi:AMP-binding protein [Streptacidiphilus carbonis]|uniref:AMP-binding protein n=1 Tax=Streptacidiphilus carbonis TaxID=105422 RepID=UPI0005A8E0B2|nr:AMP-binding protein [Streptacidiphilus carbonis]
MPATDPSPTLLDAVHAQRGRHGPGLVGDGFGFSHDQVFRAACARAALLTRLLAEQRAAHPHVGLLLDNTPEYAFWLQACALAGATAVGINPTRRGPDLLRDIRHTDCALVVTGQRRLPLLNGLDLGTPVLDSDGPHYAALLADHLDAEPPARRPAPGTRVLLTFTSGSTGAPKAVICSQGRLARAGDKVREMYRLTADDTGYACMPLFHGNATMALWAPMLLAGGTVALRPTFSASHFLDDVRRYRAGYFTYVGRAVSYVLATEERPDDADNPLRLGFGTEAGAVDAARFEARFGCRLVEGYGSSEGGCNLRQDPAAPPGAVGRVGSGPDDDLAVVDPATGEERPRSRFDASGRLLNGAEAIGELVNRTARAGFEGYWRNPAADAARVRHDWYWTGDLFHRDAGGWFHFAGRSEDWLRVDSENLAVADIENILGRWSQAEAVAVYAVPDPVAGDQVMAAVQLRPDADHADTAALAARLAGFLAAQPDLGTKMPPRFVRIVARMPATATHKTAKTGLRAERWRTEDPVLWRPYGTAAGGGALEYRPLTGDDLEKIDALFAEHGRTAWR